MLLIPTLLMFWPAAAGAPIHALILGGANNHDCEWTTPRLETLLEATGKFEVDTTTDPAAVLADASARSTYGLFVLDYNGPRWGPAAEQGFLEAVRSGTGVVAVHAANNAFPGWSEYEKMLALCWREGAGHGRFHPFDVEILTRDHPITRDLPRMVAHPDELYHHQTRFDGPGVTYLMSAFSDAASGGTGEWEPMALANRYGEGRVFVTVLGHVWRGQEATRASLDDPQFAELLARGAEWAATGAVTPPRRGPNELTPAERRAGWTSLFDGRDPSAWVEYQKDAFPAGGWVVEDGSLHVRAGSQVGDLVTRKDYRDFELAFEWKVAEGANSGVMYRVSPEGWATYQTGPEYQILDDEHHGDGVEPSTTAASLYGLYAAEGKSLAPVGQWNTGRIVCIGNHVEHWLNGKRVVACEIGSAGWQARVAASKFADWEGFGTTPSGRIALQNHGNDVWYRDLRIRDLTDPSPPRALFDGHSLDGWTSYLEGGAQTSDVWSVRDGRIVCLGQPAGYLMTAEAFADFRLRLTWRFDPQKGAGNSGVLMRIQPPHQVWPKSIEAQLHSGYAGDFWEIGGFPMSTVAERKNGRNTRATHANEKPLGQWNEYDILCWRGHVVLRVNGQILNQAWDCAELPGPIGLQSEGAEIQFGQIELIPLP